MGIKFRRNVNVPELNNLNKMPIIELKKTCKEKRIGIEYNSRTGEITGYGDQEYSEEVNPEKYGIDVIK